MGQAHRTFHRQTQPTHHRLNLHPTPTSVISTPSNVEGPRSCAEMERPLHCSLPPHPKPCHLDRRRAFAPQWRDPRIGSPSHRQNLVGISSKTQPNLVISILSNVEGPRFAPQQRDPRIVSLPTHPKSVILSAVKGPATPLTPSHCPNLSTTGPAFCRCTCCCFCYCTCLAPKARPIPASGEAPVRAIGEDRALVYSHGRSSRHQAFASLW